MKHINSPFASQTSTRQRNSTAPLETTTSNDKKYTLSYNVQATSVHEVFKLDTGANLVVYGRSLEDEG